MVEQSHANGMTYGIEAESPTACRITDNDVIDAFTGIRLITGWVPFLVQDNTVTNDVNDRNIIGIEVDLWKLAMPDEGVIEDNTITIEDGHNAYGIKAHIAGSLDITLNDISFTGEDPALNDNSGIALEEVYVSSISKNSVIGGANCMVDDDNAGIRMVNSCDNVLFCNDLADMDYGVDITAMCNFNRLTAQVIDDHNYGLLLNAPTYLGTQDHNGNRWVGTYDIIGAFIRGNSATDEVATAKKSIFKVDPSDGPTGELDPTYGPTSVQDIWFIEEAGITKTCAALPDIVVDDELYEGLILDTLGYGSFNDQMSWMAKAHAFTQILNYPSLKSNTVLDSFYDAEHEEPLGMMMIVAAKLNQQFFSWAEEKAGRQLTINTLLEDLAEIDSLLATDPSDSLNKYDDRDDIVDDLADSLALWLEDDSASLLLRLSVLGGLQDDLGNITPGNDFETDLLLAIDLQICYWLDSTISNSLKTDLLEVASKCIWEGGPAVLFAQSLYSTLKDTVFDYNSLPCEELEFRSSYFELNNVRVHPNPGSGIYTIEVNVQDNTKLTYTLLNSQGQFIHKADIDNKTETIDLSGFPSGIYILSVLKDREVIGVQKLIHQ